MQLHGKTALIIHGDIPLGREIALALGMEGASLAIHVSNPKAATEYSLDIAPSDKQAVEVYASTLVDHTAVKAMFDKVRARFGGIDILVFNAKPQPNDTVKSLSVDDLKLHVDTDVKPLFWCAKEVSKLMVARKSGKIIPVYFGISARGDADLASWSASGGAIFGLVKCLATEFVRYGINVNAVSYGYIEDVAFPPHVRTAVKDYVDYLDIRRAGTSRDVAQAVRFLATGMSDYMTGQNLYVNGGLLL
jgi:3-oxoacyl-[acyl-carrier protein] reductase